MTGVNGQPYLRSSAVVVPASVAAWLYDNGVRQIRERHRGQHVELDGVLDAFALVSTELRRAAGSARGTAVVPAAVTSAEPARGLVEQVTVATAAARIGISERAVRKAAAAGRLSGGLVDGRWRIDAASVRAYRDERAA